MRCGNQKIVSRLRKPHQVAILTFFQTIGKPVFCPKNSKNHKKCGFFGTPDENRTHNCPLGGDCYIHLTTEAECEIVPLEKKGRAFYMPYFSTYFIESQAEIIPL